jgi:hypothetical protein
MDDQDLARFDGTGVICGSEYCVGCQEDTIRPVFVVTRDHQHSETVGFPLLPYSLGIVDVESDPERSWILGRDPVHRSAPQLGFMQVLVDDTGDVNSVTAQPPLDGGWTAKRCCVDPDFPPATLKIVDQLAGSLPERLIPHQ